MSELNYNANNTNNSINNIEIRTIPKGLDCSFSNNNPNSVVAPADNIDTCNTKYINIKNEDLLIQDEEYIKTNTLITINLILRNNLINLLSKKIKNDKTLFFYNLQNIETINKSNKLTLKNFDLNTKILIISNTKILYFYYYNKIIFKKLQFSLKHWRNVSVFNKISNNLKTETENKIIKKYQNKNSALELKISKLNTDINNDKEKLEQLEVKSGKYSQFL